MDKIMIKELIRIRCLLEGIYLDSKEHKEGTQLKHVAERTGDILSQLIGTDEAKSMMIDLE